MRCKACNSKLESVTYYGRLGRHEDLCRRCFTATASIAASLAPEAAREMVGRSRLQKSEDAARKARARRR